MPTPFGFMSGGSGQIRLSVQTRVAGETTTIGAPVEYSYVQAPEKFKIANPIKPVEKMSAQLSQGPTAEEDKLGLNYNNSTGDLAASGTSYSFTVTLLMSATQFFAFKLSMEDLTDEYRFATWVPMRDAATHAGVGQAHLSCRITGDLDIDVPADSFVAIPLVLEGKSVVFQSGFDLAAFNLLASVTGDIVAAGVPNYTLLALDQAAMTAVAAGKIAMIAAA